MKNKVMKAEDLMIGDWVIDGKNIAQITSITCDGIIETTFNESSNIEVIEPIPLTTEILENNGFKKFDFLHIKGQYQWAWWENTLISVTLWCRELNNDTKDGMMLKIEAPNSSLCLKVNYIHELQHALRLCGIEKEIIL